MSTAAFRLADLVDEAHQAAFTARRLPAPRRRELAAAIAARQGVAGSYCGLPAPTTADVAAGVRVFTGERLTSRAATAHILGQEACRALLCLDVDDPAVRAALDRAAEGITARFDAARRTGGDRTWNGEYCCATCTCAVWRHLTAGGLPGVDHDAWLEAGLRDLRAHRTADGRWRRFPFFYTLLALDGIDARADAACRHAAPACERLVARAGGGAFADRRRALAARILERA